MGIEDSQAKEVRPCGIRRNLSPVQHFQSFLWLFGLDELARTSRVIARSLESSSTAW